MPRDKRSTITYNQILHVILESLVSPLQDCMIPNSHIRIIQVIYRLIHYQRFGTDTNTVLILHYICAVAPNLGVREVNLKGGEMKDRNHIKYISATHN